MVSSMYINGITLIPLSSGTKDPPTYTLSDPHGILTPAHPAIALVVGFLGRPSLPDLPKLQILITSTCRDRRTIGTETTAQYSTIVGGYVVNLLERGVRPERDGVVWEAVSRQKLFRVRRPEQGCDL
jgi:hypothetical protein